MLVVEELELELGLGGAAPRELNSIGTCTGKGAGRPLIAGWGSDSRPVDCDCDRYDPSCRRDVLLVVDRAGTGGGGGGVGGLAEGECWEPDLTGDDR